MGSPSLKRALTKWYQVLRAPISGTIAVGQHTLTFSMLRPGRFDTPLGAAENIRADMVAREIPGMTLHSPLLMKTYGKQQDSAVEFQWIWRQKNLQRLAVWEQEDPRNIRFKFPGFENMEHYDRAWVLDEIVTNVGEVNIHRCGDTHAYLQNVRKAFERTNSVGARE